MEFGHPVGPGHTTDQRPIYGDEQLRGGGLHAGEEEHHEKKPVMKKIKDKVKKIKNVVTKKNKNGHGHDHDQDNYAEREGYGHVDDDYDEDEEMDVDEKVHGSHALDPSPISVSDGQQVGSRNKPVSPDTDSSAPLPYGSVPPTNTSHTPTPVTPRGDDAYKATFASGLPHPTTAGNPRVNELSDTSAGTDLQADPTAPYSTRRPTDVGDKEYPTSAAHPRGSEEASVSPDVLGSLQDMTISEQRDGKRDDQQRSRELPEGHVASDVDRKPASYTEKLTSTAAAAKDAAASAASNVYSKVAGTVSSPRGTPTATAGQGEEETKPSYTEKLSGTALSAKDAALSAASTVYAKVAGKSEGANQAHPNTDTSLAQDNVATGPRSVKEEVGIPGENKGSYTERLSETASGAKNAALSAASTVYAKVAGGNATHPSGTHDESPTTMSTGPRSVAEEAHNAGETKGSYTEKISGTALAAKDAAVSAASNVYGKVAGAGTAVAGKAQTGSPTEHDKGVSVKGYLSEKLTPGEEDKALSEVISGSVKNIGQEEEAEKARIVLPEASAGEVEEKRFVGRNESSPAGGEEGMVDKIRGAVGSLVGSGGATPATAGAAGAGAKGRAQEELEY